MAKKQRTRRAPTTEKRRTPYIVTYKDETQSQAGAAAILQKAKQYFDDGIELLGSEKMPEPERIVHFEEVGASVVELSEDDANNLRNDDRVAEVVEDIEVFAHDDCGCGEGDASGDAWDGGALGSDGPEEVDPYEAGYQHALFEMNQGRGAMSAQRGGFAGAFAGSPAAAARPCPPGFRRRCFRIFPFLPPICFCLPGGPTPPASQAIPWNIRLVKADQVWSRATGRDVNVAIVDTGIDDDHPDLSVSGGASFVPGVTSWDDDQGHGTHCAGVAGARNNTEGVVGVAPECSLFAVKVLN